jgi:hypothetical protein
MGVELMTDEGVFVGGVVVNTGEGGSVAEREGVDGIPEHIKYVMFTLGCSI